MIPQLPPTNTPPGPQQLLKIETARKEEQINKLKKFNEEISSLVQMANFSTGPTQEILPKNIFQGSLQQDSTSNDKDPLEQFRWLVEMAQKIQKGVFDTTINDHILRLQQTVESTEEIARKFEDKIHKLDEDIEGAKELVKERKKTSDLIQNLIQERQQ